VLIEQELLGEGAFSRVVRVTEASTGRAFALKRITKAAALQCPEHIFCEQHISKNCANAFCIRQYASFKVGAARTQPPPAQRFCRHVCVTVGRRQRADRQAAGVCTGTVPGAWLHCKAACSFHLCQGNVQLA
jgi:serine/threonine protein kinase